MRPFVFLLIAVVVLGGCEPGMPSGCRSAAERIYVNQGFPTHAETFHPDSLRVFMFETQFDDTVSVQVGNSVIARRYLVTESNGFAGRVVVKVKSQEKIVISTKDQCTRFKLKDGFKYLYIRKYRDRDWSVEYSNFNRGYF